MNDPSRWVGWWLAEDGKWYPPRHAPADTVGLPGPRQSTFALVPNPHTSRIEDLAAYRGLPVGWYRDSANPALARYWDGMSLSDERCPVAEPPGDDPPARAHAALRRTVVGMEATQSIPSRLRCPNCQVALPDDATHCPSCAKPVRTGGSRRSRRAAPPASQHALEAPSPREEVEPPASQHALEALFPPQALARVQDAIDRFVRANTDLLDEFPRLTRGSPPESVASLPMEIGAPAPFACDTAQQNSDEIHELEASLEDQKSDQHPVAETRAGQGPASLESDYKADLAQAMPSGSRQRDRASDRARFVCPACKTPLVVLTDSSSGDRAVVGVEMPVAESELTSYGESQPARPATEVPARHTETESELLFVSPRSEEAASVTHEEPVFVSLPIHREARQGR